MKFKRKLDSTYPNVYETWKTDDTTWIIQDLPPEDDEEAIKFLVKYHAPDETICSIQKLVDDPLSLCELCDFWRHFLTQRMTLACYVEKNSIRTLAGLTMGAVGHESDKDTLDFKGEKIRNAFAVAKYIEEKVNPYQFMGLDCILHGWGLVVKRECRGAGLGQKLLTARQTLDLSQGIKGTAAFFTSIFSQRIAIKNGYITLLEISIRELADAGLPYPKDDPRTIKYMVKKFV